jgi:hypothetical protein
VHENLQNQIHGSFLQFLSLFIYKFSNIFTSFGVNPEKTQDISSVEPNDDEETLSKFQ